MLNIQPTAQSEATIQIRWLVPVVGSGVKGGMWSVSKRQRHNDPTISDGGFAMAKKSLLEVCPDCKAAPADAVWWHSVVSGETAEPYVHLVVRSAGLSIAVQLTPEEARSVATQGLETAGASEMDCGVYQFMAAQGDDSDEAREHAGLLRLRMYRALCARGAKS